MTDLWSLGVVFYEMLAGRRPFAGDTEAALMHAVIAAAPRSLRDFDPDVPEGAVVISTRLLEKSRDARYSSVSEFRRDLAGLIEARRPTAPGHATARPTLLRRYVVAGVAGLGLLAGAAVWWTGESADVRWARQEALPEIARLVENDDYLSAYPLASRARTYLPDDRLLGDLWARLIHPLSITTIPDGASVSFQAHRAPESEWLALGPTPLEDVALPRGIVTFRFQKDGFETVERVHFPYPILREMAVDLPAAGTVAPDMVRVPQTPLWLFQSSVVPGNPGLSPSFEIDRYEVTNAAFKVFVDAGGYTGRQWWTHEFLENGQLLT